MDQYGTRAKLRRFTAAWVAGNALTGEQVLTIVATIEAPTTKTNARRSGIEYPLEAASILIRAATRIKNVQPIRRLIRRLIDEIDASIIKPCARIHRDGCDV